MTASTRGKNALPASVRRIGLYRY